MAKREKTNDKTRTVVRTIGVCTQCDRKRGRDLDHSRIALLARRIGEYLVYRTTNSNKLHANLLARGQKPYRKNKGVRNKDRKFRITPNVIWFAGIGMVLSMIGGAFGIYIIQHFSYWDAVFASTIYTILMTPISYIMTYWFGDKNNGRLYICTS